MSGGEEIEDEMCIKDFGTSLSMKLSRKDYLKKTIKIRFVWHGKGFTGERMISGRR